MATPPPEATSPDLLLILSSGVVLAICAAVIAYLKWKQPPKP